MAKLKVFRAASGFHDVYVAAPSRAAALRAWGAKTDLFAMGAAEVIVDPELTAKPLAKPGTVFRVKRSGAANSKALSEVERPKKRPPSRAALDRAEHALAALRTGQQAEMLKLDGEIARLEQSRQRLALRHAKELAKREKAVATARDRFEALR